MDIIIGRDAINSQLKVSIGNQTKSFGTVGSVPNSVSREHIKITVDNNGGMKISNINPANKTFVNGVAVEMKSITTDDEVELGNEHYKLDWKLLDGIVPNIMDVKHLKNIWENYYSSKNAQQIADRRFNALRSVTGIITMAAIALTMFTGAKTLPYIIAYIVAILLTICFTVKAYIDAKRVPVRNMKLTENFEKQYICPHCHRFLGYTSFTVLMQNGRCNYCKTKFKI